MLLCTPSASAPIDGLAAGADPVARQLVWVQHDLTPGSTLRSGTSTMSFRILVVEDHPALLAATVAAFEAEGPHFVEGARNGEEALRRLTNEHFDLVVSDLRMPELDGIQLIERFPLRASHCPALAIVSGDSPQILAGACQAARARGLSVLGSYSKPFTRNAAAELLRILVWNRAVRAGEAPASRANPSSMIITALQKGEIHAWYQPKYSLTEERIVGVEALARWLHPELGVLLPQAFMPELIREGLSERLLWSVLRQSLEAQRYWQTLGHTITVSVNLHTRLLDDLELPDRLYEFVTNMGAGPGGVCFELTESTSTLEASRYYSGASRLRMMGFGLSQDDFGTGYSSFYRLVATPFSELKLDRSMIQNAASDPAFRKALASIVTLGKDLGLTVVAEGVETSAEMQLLQGMKCDMIQGFLISPAVDAESLGRQLAGDNRPFA
ncbi:EAL domain-containing response regulator [Pseudomonas aeruginosa]